MPEAEYVTECQWCGEPLHITEAYHVEIEHATGKDVHIECANAIQTYLADYGAKVLETFEATVTKVVTP